MKKILVNTLAVGLLTAAGQTMAATASVALVDDGFYFSGPFPGTQMWIPENISFRDHVAFDAQSYLKFDIASGLAGIDAADITSATLSWSTYHMNEDIPSMVWRSPLDGTSVNLDMSPYASAVDMALTTQPATVAGANAAMTHTVFDIAGAADGTYLETISMDITSIVQSWVDGSYANHGIKMDILGAGAGEKFYMRAFSMEDDIAGGTMYAASLDVSYVPVPAAVWLFGSGLLGLVGIARRRQA